MPRRFQARGNASLMSFSTGSSGTRFDWELPRHGASLSYTPDVGAALLRLPSWTPMRIHRRGSDGFTRSGEDAVWAPGDGEPRSVRKNARGTAEHRSLALQSAAACSAALPLLAPAASLPPVLLASCRRPLQV